MRFSLINNQRGNLFVMISLTLVFTLVVSGVVASVGGMIGGSNDIKFERIRLKFESQFRARVLNEISWENTLSAPENEKQLKCISELPPGVGERPYYCTTEGEVINERPGIGDSITLYEAFDDADGNPVPFYSAKDKDKSQGFNLRGQACDTFKGPPAPGNDQCPLRIDLQLVVHCETNGIDPCAYNSLNIEGKMIYNPSRSAQKAGLNFEKRKFIIKRPPLARMSRNNCVGIGGEDGIAPGFDCALPIKNMKCPKGYALIGFESGRPLCAPVVEEI